MRLLTMLMVSALLIMACVAFANGSGTATTTPSEETVTTPSGAGATTPEATTPSTETTTPSTETTTPSAECAPSTTTTTPETTTPETTTTTPEVTTPEVTTPETTETAPAGAGPTVPTGIMTATTPEVETFNTNLVATTFGIDRTSVTSLRQAGWSWGDINLMAQIAQKTGQPISQIASLRAQGLSYTDIAARYNLTAMDVTIPSPVVTRVAGAVTEYGYQPIYYLTDPWGNPVLTRFEAERLSRLGYRWQDIAVASNISAKTGAPVTEVLSWIDRGYTWPQVARQYGLSPRSVMDISRYPFAPAGIAPSEAMITGAGPMRTTRHRKYEGAVETVPPSGMGPGASELQPNTGMPDGRNY